MDSVYGVVAHSHLQLAVLFRYASCLCSVSGCPICVERLGNGSADTPERAKFLEHITILSFFDDVFLTFFNLPRNGWDFTPFCGICFGFPPVCGQRKFSKIDSLSSFLVGVQCISVPLKRRRYGHNGSQATG